MDDCDRSFLSQWPAQCVDISPSPFLDSTHSCNDDAFAYHPESCTATFARCSSAQTYAFQLHPLRIGMDTDLRTRSLRHGSDSFARDLRTLEKSTNTELTDQCTRLVLVQSRYSEVFERTILRSWTKRILLRSMNAPTNELVTR